MTVDQYELNRFIHAQEDIYGQVISELKNGHKKSHWMWFIFPQIKGLGHSSSAQKYAIKNLDEATEYLNHPILGSRLIECCELLLAINDHSIAEILGYPDDLKLRSSMTLFAAVKGANPVFKQLLNQYFNGINDTRTIEILHAVTA